jgi:hypothetical protein
MIPRNNYLGVQAFSSIFKPLSSYVADRIAGYKFEHRELTEEEHEQALLTLVKGVYETALPVSGPARHPIWEKGWAENLDAFDANRGGLELARPHYFDKHPVVRWRGRLYQAESTDYEYNMLCVLQDYLFDKYFRDAGAAFEFGCGTGHNLFRVRHVNETALLHGFDWADSAVKFIHLLAQHGKLRVTASKFDFFNPDWSLNLGPGSHVYTVAALEQTGHNYHAWVNYILRQKPKIVAHIEPIAEVLDHRTNLLDYLCAQYFRKRNYLDGYLDYLRLLESHGKIKIHEVTRTGVGSMFIEGYTILVWSSCP